MMKTRKKYRIRQYSPIWWIGTIAMFTGMFVMVGLLTSWDMGLL